MIFPDLEKAGKLLENFTAPDKYTISLALVYGLKARAYLERGTDKNDAAAYRSAAEYARKAITASGRTPLTRSGLVRIRENALRNAEPEEPSER